MGSMLSPPSTRKPANQKIIASISEPTPRSRGTRKREADDLCRPGFRRLTVDVPAGDHAKFKSACALRGTTLHAEICGFIRAAIAAPYRLLSEALFLEISPEFKAELLDYAAARNCSLADLLLEAFAQLQRQEPEIEALPERRQPAPEPNRRNIQFLWRRRHP